MRKRAGLSRPFLFADRQSERAATMLCWRRIKIIRENKTENLPSCIVLLNGGAKTHVVNREKRAKIMAWVGTEILPHEADVRAWLRRTLDPERSEEHTSEIQSIMRNSYDVFC